MSKLFILIPLLYLISIVKVQGSGPFNKAIILGNKLYYYEEIEESVFMGIKRNPKNKDAYLRIITLDSTSKPIYNDFKSACNYSERYDFSFSWDIYADYAYSIRTNGGYGARVILDRAPDFMILKVPLDYKDTIQIIKDYKDYIEKVNNQYPDPVESIQAQSLDQDQLVFQRNKRNLKPLFNFIQFQVENITSWGFSENPFSYDFKMIDNNTLELFFRDSKSLSYWSFNYPEPGAKDSRNNWNEKITYTKDSIYHLSRYDSVRINKYGNQYSFKKEYLPKKYLYSSINDDDFFTGNFKVIKQDNNKYILNLNHGSIYWIDSEEINKIGQIDVASYESVLFDRKFYIEDRDHNTIIFFAEVDWMDNEYPKPKVKIIEKVSDFINKYEGLKKL